MSDPPKSVKTKVFVPRPDRAYIVFNKPYEVLTQFTQPEGSEKQTLAGFGFPPDVYPVGRLDYDSEGMLVLSDDTWMNQALLAPDHAHERKYLVQVENVPDKKALSHLEYGVMLDGKRTAPARARLLKPAPELPERSKPIRFRASIPTAWIELTLTEGRNRQVRRMTAAVGHPTLRLFRAQIGKVNLLELGVQPGEWKQLTVEQTKLLFSKSNK